jgi:hypothetical protein
MTKNNKDRAAYVEGHKRIFGERTERRKETTEEVARRALNAKRYHAKLAADGKKDAQYYLDHEQRVSQDPNFKASPQNTEEYKAGYAAIFGKKKDKS